MVQSRKLPFGGWDASRTLSSRLCVEGVGSASGSRWIQGWHPAELELKLPVRGGLSADRLPVASASHREDISNLSHILSLERNQRRDEISIDMEDRPSKKGTPPRPTEEGDIRELRSSAGPGASANNNNVGQRPAPMVE